MVNNIRPRLGRPRMRRRIKYGHKMHYFKPRSIPMRDLEVVELTTEELEALRLKNIKELDQHKCAEAMRTSQSTFQRVLSSAYKKISLALVKGKAIKIINN